MRVERLAGLDRVEATTALHQRRGLARALLTEGLDRLVRRGATRLKVGFDGEAGRALYLGAGFVVESIVTAHRR